MRASTAIIPLILKEREARCGYSASVWKSEMFGVGTLLQFDELANTADVMRLQASFLVYNDMELAVG